MAAVRPPLNIKLDFIAGKITLGTAIGELSLAACDKSRTMHGFFALQI